MQVIISLNYRTCKKYLWNAEMLIMEIYNLLKTNVIYKFTKHVIDLLNFLIKCKYKYVHEYQLKQGVQCFIYCTRYA